MHEVAVETLFARFRETGDPEALAAVFDELAPKLVLVAAHVAGRDVAEDAVQATFVDAIRQRQRWDCTRPLAPWLIGLLGNHVREARRQRRRVPDPLRVATKASEPAAAQAEANECFEAVGAAVSALPRHYRQVLSLRLVHGLELQQIAHSLDVPLGTVKVRLHRGLALLRRALPAGLTASSAMFATPSLGLAAAREAVLAEAVAVGSGLAASAGILFGGMLMKKLVLSSAVLSLAVVGWFASRPRDAATPASTSVQASAPVVAAAATEEAKAPPAAAVSTADAPPQLPSDVGRSEAPTTGSLVVQSEWQDGVPAPSLTLMASRNRERPSPSATSDANGRAVFDALAPGDYRVVAAGATQDNEASRVEVRAGEAATLRLVVGGDIRLRVTVVDADGNQRRAASVWTASPATGSQTPRELGTTGVHGEFSYRGLPVRDVWARASGAQPSQRHELQDYRREGLPTEPVEVRLTLGPAGCTLLGNVAAPDGRGAAAARIAIACDDTLTKPRPEILVLADAQGVFRCDEVPAGERTVVASLPEFAPAIARVTTQAAEPVTVALQLQVGVTLSGRVTDAAGQAVGRAQVAVQPPFVPGLQVPACETRTDADGQFMLRAIRPGPFVANVYVEPELERSFTGADGEHLVWNVTKEPERAIRGVVVDADDKPLAQWRVNVMAPFDPKRQSSPHRPAITDAQGRFRVRGLEDAPYRVFVFAARAGDGAARSAAAAVPCAVLDDVRPAAEERTIRVPAEAMASAWIEGSLSLPDGELATAELSLYPRALRGGAFMVPQDRLEPGCTTYRIGPLPPGEYSLLCDIEGRGRLTHDGLRLVANETRKLPPFDFTAQRPLAITLRHADGRPATGAIVKLESWPVACTESAPGRYESIPVGAGDDKITVHGPDIAPATFAVRRGGSEPVEFTVRPATPVVVRLSPSTPRERWVGALRVSVLDASGTKLFNELLQLDAGAEFRWHIGLLPGTYTLDFTEMLHGCVSTTATVGTAPLQIDLQMTQ